SPPGSGTTRSTPGRCCTSSGRGRSGRGREETPRHEGTEPDRRDASGGSRRFRAQRAEAAARGRRRAGAGARGGGSGGAGRRDGGRGTGEARGRGAGGARGRGAGSAVGRARAAGVAGGDVPSRARETEPASPAVPPPVATGHSPFSSSPTDSKAACRC